MLLTKPYQNNIVSMINANIGKIREVYEIIGNEKIKIYFKKFMLSKICCNVVFTDAFTNKTVETMSLIKNEIL